MLNRITAAGRLTKDPEMRTTDSGVFVTSFSIACERDLPNRTTGERETDFLDVVTWRSLAEFVKRNFTKGRLIIVSGRLQERKWQDKDGKQRRAMDIVADQVYFADSKKLEKTEPKLEDLVQETDDDGHLPF